MDIHNYPLLSLKHLSLHQTLQIIDKREGEHFLQSGPAIGSYVHSATETTYLYIVQMAATTKPCLSTIVFSIHTQAFQIG